MIRQRFRTPNPQRKHYSCGAIDSDMIWTAWEVLEEGPFKDGPARLKFWQDLNADAVKARGPIARRQFELYSR